LDVGREAKSKRTGTYMLPVVIDDVHVVGLSRNVGHVDLRKTTLPEAVELLVRKIEESEIGS
jgi:hypothetical protein